MPSPSTALNGYRPDLGMMFEFDVEMDNAGFIANRMAPVFEAAEQNGTLGIIPLKQLRQTPQTGRNDRGQYNRVNFTFRDEAYATLENGLEMPIDQRRAAIYRNWFDFEVVSTAITLNMVLRAYEMRVAALLHNATTFTSYTSAITEEWNDWTNAVPITDVQEAKLLVWAETGIYPDALQINKRQFDNLRMCDQITTKIASSGAGTAIKPADVTKEILANCFDVREIIVANSSKDSANEGQDVSIAQVWSDEYAMLFKSPRTNRIEEP
ncbi:MAG TPA: hypothetical protein VMX74_13800, partial [Pirellulales bacterium]|nr:hypothetical protein [Pirellulales bacterium]